MENSGPTTLSPRRCHPLSGLRILSLLLGMMGAGWAPAQAQVEAESEIQAQVQAKEKSEIQAEVQAQAKLGLEVQVQAEAESEIHAQVQAQAPAPAKLGLEAPVQAQAPAKGDRYYLAHYNVENLFDTIDQADTEDGDFTPGGKLNWNAERLSAKMAKLTQVVGELNRNQGPDLLGLCEVENRGVIEQWLTSLKRTRKHYRIVHSESPDARGIDVALIFDSNRMKLHSHTTAAVTLPGQPEWKTRDILCARFHFGKDKPMFVLVNHWPSRRGGQEQTDPLRAAAARVARRLVDSLHHAYPGGVLVVMGDFNDRPADAAPLNVLQSGPVCREGSATGMERAMNPSVLYNPFAEIDNGTSGSYRYKDAWQFIDHISLSHRVCEKDSWVRYIPGSAASVSMPYLLQSEGKYAGYPFRTYGGENYLGGYSDHLPVKVELQITK